MAKKNSLKLLALLGVVVLVGIALGLSTAAWSEPGTATGPPNALIYRDEYGVPHVYANNSYDLFYAVGYVTAQDRLFQLETYRRAGKGTLAEVLGPDYLEDDKLIRQEFYSSQERQAQFQALDPEYQMILEAYRDGINAWIAQVRADPTKLPFEYAAVGLQPADWTIDDSVALIQLMVRRFGEAGGVGGNELDDQELYQHLLDTYGPLTGGAIFNDVVWNNDPAAPVTIPAIATDTARAVSPPQLARRVDASVLREAGQRFARVKAHLAELGVPTKLGSYAWAVDGQKSELGVPMLVGGPQMGYSVPHIAHEIGIHGAGFDAVGMAFAGAPAVLIGTNEDLAWTSTSGIGDQVDIYIEFLNPANPHQYWYNGAWRDMESRVETINVAGADPVELTVYRTVHGPVFAWDLANNTAMSQRRSHWNQELNTWAAFIEFDRARNVADFARGVDMIVTSHNFIYADRAGNIAYWQGGRQPIRPRGYDPRLPLPGNGQAEWEGILPREQMPFVQNPAQGYLANWNNKPRADWDNGDDADWGAIFRVQRIMDLLEADASLSWQDMLDMDHDIGRHDYRADQLLPYLLAAAQDPAAPSDPRLGQALQILRDWSHRLAEGPDESSLHGTVGESIFDRWRDIVRGAVFGDELGPFVDRGFIKDDTADNMLLHALRGQDASLPPSRDYFNGVNPNVVLVQALIDALDALETERGTADMTQWTWDLGTIQFRWQGQLLGEIPWASRGSYIQIVKLTSPVIQGVNTLPPGQSGFAAMGEGGVPLFDPHFLDQLEGYRTWEYKTMHLRNMVFHLHLPTVLLDWP